MQYLLGVFVIWFSASLAVVAQHANGSKACPVGELEKGVIVAICTHERGMAPIGQPRLFFRLHQTGRAEFEIDTPEGLQIKDIQLPEKETKFIKNIIALPDIATAKNEYPLNRRFVDSSMETRITLPAKTRERTILLHNFSLDDPNNSTHYPAAIILLIMTAVRLRDQAMGVTKHIPNISFCSMVETPDYSNGREIELYADFSHLATVLASGVVKDERDVIYDRNCSLGTHVTVQYEGEPSAIDAMKKTLAIQRTERYGVARILARGRYEEKVDPRTRSRIRTFYMMEVKHIEPVDRPYDGELEIGWNYVDTLNVPTDTAPIGLSVPIKHPRPNYTADINWTNPEMFLPVLKRGRTAVVFRVTGSTTRLIPPGKWRETFNCKILEVK